MTNIREKKQEQNEYYKCSSEMILKKIEIIFSTYPTGVMS